MPALPEPYFTLELDGQEIQRFRLDKARTSIGRARESEIQIAVRGVSRMHAIVIRDDEGKCALRDLGSANGTYVNGGRIEDEHILAVGDVINFLDYALCFRRDEPKPDESGLMAFSAEESIPTMEGLVPALIEAAPIIADARLPSSVLPAGATPYELEVEDSSLGNQIYPIDRAVTTIGGEAASDIHVSGRGIEKHHSLLVIVEERLVFVRLSPVHIARVNSAARLVCYLEPNDEISIGNSLIRVRKK